MAKKQVRGIRQEIKRLEKEMSTVIEGKEKKKKKKENLIPRKVERTLKKSKKKVNSDKILFFYLRKNGRMEGPFLKKYSGDFITLNYKPHEVEPRSMWDWGKYKVYIFKEVDRRPVSNLNLKEIKRRGDLTDSDELLLKATMKAISEGVKKQLNKGALILIGVVVIGITIFFFSS